MSSGRAPEQLEGATLKPTIRRLLAGAAVLLLAIPVGALQQGDAPSRIRTRAELVVVPVTVKDRQGNLVEDIRREEFRVFEDGVEQEIALFSAEAFPLSAVVLLDNDLPVKTADEVQRSLESIAAGFSASDEVALMVFDQTAQPVLDFTRDNDKVFTQLKRMRLTSTFPGEGSGPMTAGPRINAQSASPKVPGIGITPIPAITKSLDDAIHAAGELLRGRGRDRRKLIFIVSDGLNSRHNTFSSQDTIQLLLSADISVYALAVGPAILKHESSLLVKYATDTGGDFFYAAKSTELERLYSVLTEQARNQYTLAFVPHRPDPSRDYHSIEVKVKRPRLILLARQGYYNAGTR